MRAYIFNILKWLDEGGNVLFIPMVAFVFRLPYVPAQGRDCYTISQWFAELRERGLAVGCVGCKVLTWLFKWANEENHDYDHCTSAMNGMPENVDAG